MPTEKLQATAATNAVADYRIHSQLAKLVLEKWKEVTMDAFYQEATDKS